MATWGLLYLATHYFTDIISVPPATITATTDYFTFGFKGYGQVIFQNSITAGILFFIAVFINSPISGLYGLVGGILSAVIAFKLSAPINDISIGWFSFNAVLCAIVFAGNEVKDGIWVLISIILSLAISLLLLKLHIPQLTFPFVLASCLTLLLQKTPFQSSNITTC